MKRRYKKGIRKRETYLDRDRNEKKNVEAR
jgi:hypothetical protein